MPHLRQGGDLGDDPLAAVLDLGQCPTRSSRSDSSPLSWLTSGGLLQKLTMPMVRCSFASTATTSCLTAAACPSGTPPFPKATCPMRS